MAQLKFISREKLVEYLDEELRQFLNDRGFYEINQYGWSEDGERDPEYLGHALWQENPPELKKLQTLGEEFSNLMRSARHSLGLAYLYHDATDSLLNDSGYSFNYHCADTGNKLNFSSDRIREFLITAYAHHCTGRDSYPLLGKIVPGERDYGTFSAPFQQILEEVSQGEMGSHELRIWLSDLLPLVEVVAHNRLENQDPTRRLILSQSRIADTVHNLAMGYPDEVLTDDLSSENDSSCRELADWYNALIKISNLVFMAEHQLRQLRRHNGSVTDNSQKRKVM